MKLTELKRGELPKAPHIKELLGPSFILIGLGLGSGELILWPYLSSNYGLGIMWGALLGITFQFFLNMEIERYTLITGESVFAGLTRKLAILAPIWFIISTLVPWMWPGIIASSGKTFAAAIGIPYTPVIPIVFLVIIGLVLTLGPVLYKTQETLQKIVIMLGVPFMFILAFILTKSSEWLKLFSGLAGRGDSYWFLPEALPLATFLGAFAYAGAGGNLNLAQSLYIKEKGYAMGKYAGRITSLLTGKKENLSLFGTTFEANDSNISEFKVWWKRVNIEHLVVFWLTGVLTMCVLAVLAFSTAYGKSGNATGIQFVINEAQFIMERTVPYMGTLFLIAVSIMLFFTQFSVFGSTARIMAENFCLLSDKINVNKLPLYFFSFLWLQIFAGIIIFLLGFTEPLGLVIVSAVLNAVSMFIYSGLILWLNLTSLPKELKPSIVRIIAVLSAFLFYGSFSVFTLVQYLTK